MDGTKIRAMIGSHEKDMVDLGLTLAFGMGKQWCRENLQHFTMIRGEFSDYSFHIEPTIIKNTLYMDFDKEMIIAFTSLGVYYCDMENYQWNMTYHKIITYGTGSNTDNKYFYMHKLQEINEINERRL